MAVLSLVLALFLNNYFGAKLVVINAFLSSN